VGVRQNIKGGKWLSFKITEVIEEDGLCCRRCDCENVPRWVPCCEIGAVEIELPTGVLSCRIPNAESVVFAAGKKVILAWVER